MEAVHKSFRGNKSTRFILLYTPFTLKKNIYGYTSACNVLLKVAYALCVIKGCNSIGNTSCDIIDGMYSNLTWVSPENDIGQTNMKHVKLATKKL